MPLKIRLFDDTPAEKESPLGGYPQAIAEGIALGLRDLGEIVMDAVVYPAFDAAVICAHLSHFNLNETETAIRNNPTLYTDLVHRMESRVELGNDVIYELPLLAYDIGIIVAQQANAHPDFAELKACLDNNPTMYQQSALRIKQRMQPIEGAFEHFMQATGPEKAGILAELSTVFLGPGFLLKGTAAIKGAVKTYQEFGAPRVARFHPLIAKDISRTSLKFELLSVEDIRATPGENSYIWTYGKDKKLKIASRDLPMDPLKEPGSGHFLRHHELANADWFYETLSNQKITRQILHQLEKEGWVYGAGEAHFNYGNLEKLTIRSGHFKPKDFLFTPDPGRWAEQLFNDYGFSEAPGKYKPLILSFLEEEYSHPTVSYAKTPLSLPQKISGGIAGTALMGRAFLESSTSEDDASKTGFAARFKEHFLLGNTAKNEEKKSEHHEHVPFRPQFDPTVTTPLSNETVATRQTPKRAQISNSDLFSSDRWLTQRLSQPAEERGPSTKPMNSIQDAVRRLEAIKEGVACNPAYEASPLSHLQSQAQWQPPAQAGYVHNEGLRFFSHTAQPQASRPCILPSQPHQSALGTSFFMQNQMEANRVANQFQDLTSTLLHSANGYKGC